MFLLCPDICLSIFFDFFSEFSELFLDGFVSVQNSTEQLVTGEEINKEPGSTTKNEALKTKLNPTEKLYRTGKLFFYVGVTLFIVSFTKVL
jgi:hypothetical protein